MAQRKFEVSQQSMSEVRPRLPLVTRNSALDTLMILVLGLAAVATVSIVVLPLALIAALGVNIYYVARRRFTSSRA